MKKRSEKWSTSEDCWPDVIFGNVYVFLLDHPDYSPMSLTAYRSLEAYKLFDMGCVQQLSTRYSPTGCCIVKAHVKGLVPSI